MQTFSPPSLETSLHTVTHSLNCMSPKVKPLSAFHTDEAPGFITFYFTCIVSLTSTSIYAADCRSEPITVLNKKAWPAVTESMFQLNVKAG